MLVLTVIQLALSFFFFLSQSVMTSSFLTFLFIGLTFFSLSTHHSSSLWLGWVRIYVFTPFCVAREENMLSCWEEMDVKKGLLWCHTHAGGVTADEHSKLLRNTNTHTHTHAHEGWRALSVLKEPGSPLVVHETSGAHPWIPGPHGNPKSTPSTLPALRYNILQDMFTRPAMNQHL